MGAEINCGFSAPSTCTLWPALCAPRAGEAAVQCHRLMGGACPRLTAPAMIEKGCGTQRSIILLLHFHTFTVYLTARPAEVAVGM